MENRIVMLPVRVLHPHPDNPRKNLGDLTELADSIRAFGVLQNLTVVPMGKEAEDMAAVVSGHYGEEADEHGSSLRGGAEQEYTVIAGHRRRAAAELAGVEAVPCIVTELSPLEQMSVMMSENLQREALTPIEQAQGFQLMIDLGADVDQIAEKTGMSKRRVKARLEISRLDQKKLTDAMKKRQISLADLEKLARIEDVEKRNTLLDKVGTYNFDFSYNRLFNAQEAKKIWPELQKVLREAKAKKLQDSDRWKGEYDKQIDMDITDGAEALEKAIKKLRGEVFYWSSPEDNDIWLYTKEKKKAPEKRPQEEIEADKLRAQTWEEIDRLRKEFYELRRGFILEQTVTKDNREIWIRGAMMAMVVREYYYGGDRGLLDETLDVSGLLWKERPAAARSTLRTKKEKVWPGLIYALYGDGKENDYVVGYRSTWPRHEASGKLDALYELLEALGYHMCDGERAMFDGTHELLHRGEEAAAPRE